MAGRACDADHLASNVPRRLGREKADDVGDILGLARGSLGRWITEADRAVGGGAS